MKRDMIAAGIATTVLALSMQIGSAGAHDGVATTAPVIEETTRQVDLAICLDTSGSMSGLIESAKQKLWAIVNDLALAEPTPKLRVALLTYGNDGHNAEGGWVRIDSGLTEDLDLISQQLFALTTNGGTEYVGRVLQNATLQLDWHPSDDALKLIIVAGNESAEQDQQSPFREMCREAIARGIMINSIYCGPDTDTIAPAWREVARLADGQYASIDHDGGTVVIETPFDERLSELSSSVNATYIQYGFDGARGLGNQVQQDGNAESLNSAAVAQRAMTKSSALYCNSSWDLVDACTIGNIKLADVKEEDLPENMQKMTPEQREAYVQKMNDERTAIQEQIKDLAAKRSAFVQNEMKKLAVDDESAFDAAIRRAVRQQAESKGFRYQQAQDEAPRPEQEATSENDGC